MPDLTPIATELQQLRTFHAQWEVDQLLDASFARDQYHRCICGAMIAAVETACHPCTMANRDRGPIYGASLAGHGVANPSARIAELEAENASLRLARFQLLQAEERIVDLTRENTAMAERVVYLAGQLSQRGRGAE